MKDDKVTIGLFGTCGNSTWRTAFINKYEELNINYFNPQIENDKWKPEDAIIEAEHLSSDEIILFPVISETYGLGSLSEVGLSILNAIKLDERREVVVLIDKIPDKILEEDKVLYKESTKQRALVTSHLKKMKYANVYFVETLEELLEVSIVLYNAAKMKKTVERYSLSSNCK